MLTFNSPIINVSLIHSLTNTKMKRKDILKQHQQKLNKRYKQLVEQAYDLRQTDHALSDVSEYKAMKLLNKLNKLKFLSRENSQPIS